MSAMTVNPAGLGWGDGGSVRSAGGHLRLTGRGRGLLIAVALGLAATWTVLGPGAHAGDGVPAVQVTAVTVAPGQTLWQLARSVAGPDQDVRDVVDELVQLNGLDGVALQVGQQLLVPVTDAG